MPLLLSFLILTASGLDPEIEAVQGRRLPKEERRMRGRGPQAAATPPVDPALDDCATLAHNNSDAAIAKAQKWIATSDGPAARQCLGLGQAAGGHWTEAAAAFREGAGLAGTDAGTATRLWAQAGNAALAGGDLVSARASLDSALAGGMPDGLEKGEAYLDRARARVGLKDEVGARGDMDNALRYAAADPLAWLLSATLARRMNDLPLARKHIAEAVRLAGDDASVALEQGVIAALSSDDEQAKAAFQRAERIAGDTSAIGTRARTYLTQLGVGPASVTAQGR